MTLEDYRRQIGWSRGEMARQAGIDYNTLKRAIDGVSIAPRTAQGLAQAISRALGRTVLVGEINGLNVSY